MTSRIRRRTGIRWLVFLLVGWVAVVLVMWSLENRLVFLPSPAADSLPIPDPRIQDVTFASADGTSIHAWYLPAIDPTADVVLVSHGNGGNLTHRGKRILDLHAHLGTGVLVYDYPGYGRSGGSPSERGCYAAGDAALAWLESRGIPNERVVLKGESLGGGVAVDLASRHPHAALVLQATFTSLPAAAKSHYPWLPCQMLMTNRFDSLSKLPKCRRPTFVIHGTADRVVPYEQGKALFDAAAEPKEFFTLEGADHNDPLPPEMYEALKRFLAKNR